MVLFYIHRFCLSPPLLFPWRPPAVLQMTCVRLSLTFCLILRMWMQMIMIIPCSAANMSRISISISASLRFATHAMLNNIGELCQAVYNSFFVLQTAQAVKQKYLDGREVTGNMRAILIDWLVQVQIKFRLLQETMYMTVAIIDRFLQVRCWTFSVLMLSHELFLMCNFSRCSQSGSSSSKEATAACWCNSHVHCFQVWGDVSTRDRRLCLCDRPCLHHFSDLWDGDADPQGSWLQFWKTSAPAVPQESFKDWRCKELLSSRLKFSVL